MKTQTSVPDRLLLIASSPRDARNIQDMFMETASPYEVVSINRLSEGLDWLGRGTCALILLDLNLPDSQGLETLQIIQQHTPDTPVIVLSESVIDPMVLDAVKQQAAGYLFKDNVGSRELTCLVACTIERYQKAARSLEREAQYGGEDPEDRFYTAIGRNHDGILILDHQGIILFLNPAAENLLCRGPDELLYREFGFPIVSAESTELHIVCADEPDRQVEMYVYETSWKGQGAYLATLHDITTRKRSERALRESERRYRTLLSSVTDYIYTVEIQDGKAVRTTHSPNCVAVTGYTTEEYRATPDLWYLMIYEEDRAMVADYIAHIHRGDEVAPLEHRIVHKDGSIRWIKNTYVAYRDERGILRSYDGLVSDITERKEAENEVHRLNAELELRVAQRTAELEAMNQELENEIFERRFAEEKLRKLSRAVEQSPAVIVITNTDGDIEYVNPRFTQVTGYTYHEALGQNPRILKSGHMASETYQQLWETITSGHEWRGEFLNRRRNGDLYWELASISPIVNSLGQIISFLAVKEDISERKEAEAELRKAWKTAEAATRTKSEFLAHMSHEIRTPLNAIIGMATLLTDSDLPSEESDYVQTIRVCGENLLAIINDILDFSKIEAGKMEIDQSPFVLDECLEETIGLVAHRAQEKQLELLYTISEHIPMQLVGDSLRLRQILTNLLSNAVKFTEHGEVVVAVEQAEYSLEHMSHPAFRAPLALHITVQDTGIGIPQERLGRLFHSFSQADGSINRRFGGTGLGLAISRRLAELMGGTMWVESEQGQGSTFHVTLVVDSATEQSSPNLRTRQPTLEGRRVLLVGNRPTMLRSLSYQVGLWGLEPRTTASTTQALEEILQEERFDLAILDHSMADVDSLTLANRIRLFPGCQSLPLIILTSLGVNRSLFHARSLSSLYLVSKPVRYSRLYQLLQTLLGVERREFSDPTPLAEDTPQVARRSRAIPDLAKQHPLRILLVEDDAFNQKAILLILQRLGYRPDVVSTGREALEKVQQRTYDVLLMDVEMPEMDGVETTRQIRFLVHALFQPWIIAMTAHAMDEKRTHYLIAGMDDYVSKPIHLDELMEALKKVVPRQVESPPLVAGGGAPVVDASCPPGFSSDISPPSPLVAAPSVEQSMDTTRSVSDLPGPVNRHPVDLQALESFLEAIGQNTSDMKYELITLFLETAPDLLDTMQQAISQRKPHELGHAAHTLKSSSAQMGALSLVACCRQLEQQYEAVNLEQLQEQVNRAEAEFFQVREILAGFLQA